MKKEKTQFMNFEIIKKVEINMMQGNKRQPLDLDVLDHSEMRTYVKTDSGTHEILNQAGALKIIK